MPTVAEDEKSDIYRGAAWHDLVAGGAGRFAWLEANWPDGYNIWIDEIRWARLTNIETFRPSLNPVSQFQSPRVNR